jgi:hypothetical protein
MKTLSKAAQQCAELDKQNTVLLLALNDQVNGKTKWFTVFGHKLGVSRPDSACGGVVIAQSVGGVAMAHYWETYKRETLAHIAAVITGEASEHTRDLMRRRSLIETVSAYVAEQLRAAA